MPLNSSIDLAVLAGRLSPTLPIYYIGKWQLVTVLSSQPQPQQNKFFSDHPATSVKSFHHLYSD